MKTQSYPFNLPITTTGTDATNPLDLGSANQGFCIQFVGIAGGGTYVVEASFDDETWVDVTAALTNLNTDVEAADPIAADGMYLFPYFTIPGPVRIRCTGDGTGTPKAWINYQDSRTV